MMFDRVVLINLKRRPDRLAAFRACQSRNGWGLSDPVVIPAIDGNEVGVPRHWLSGGGAWGCARSHIGILEKALMDGVKSLLVLEDDATWKSTAWSELESFLSRVPSDWDQLMLGGQHIQGPSNLPDASGIVRCLNCQRTHAYAIRGPAIRDLLSVWYSCNSHIDHHMGPWQSKWKVYAPHPFIFGQSEGQSDINGRVNPPKFWSAPSGRQVIIVLRATHEVALALRGRGLHMGYDRDPESDYDKGLIEIAQRKDQRLLMMKWLDTILWEVASDEGSTACVWHPDISLDLVKEASHDSDVFEVSGSLKECLSQLNARGLALRENYASEYLIHLESSREVMEILRAHGWHSGNWRDSITGLDNGLRQVDAMRLPEDRARRLKEWIVAVSKEALSLRGGVATLWHPRISPEEMQELTNLKVVSIIADSPERALEFFKEARS